jgi:Ca-activated chloride channel family protein
MKAVWVVSTIALLLVLHPELTQGQSKPPASPPLTVRVETNLVALDVTAIDHNGNYVRDLRREEFELLEGGIPRPFDLFAVTSQSSLSRPLAVVMALDLSGSLKPEEAVTLREAALKFVDLMKGDSVFAAVTFNHEVKVRQRFTKDGSKLAKTLRKVTRFEGSTRLYDAIDRSVQLLDREAPRFQRGIPLRRAVIVISDGFDSASVIDRREMVQRAMRAGVTIYSITLPSYMLSPTQQLGRVLTPLDATRLVHATGGTDFSADVQNIQPVFQALAEEIQSSYTLAFYADRYDGQYHALSVRTTRPGIQLRLNRRGYQAPQARNSPPAKANEEGSLPPDKRQ